MFKWHHSQLQTSKSNLRLKGSCALFMAMQCHCLCTTGSLLIMSVQYSVLWGWVEGMLNWHHPYNALEWVCVALAEA